MASRREILSISGPPPIPVFEWNNLYHRASLISCLVQGVYTMERHRQQNRYGSNSVASPWWMFYNFTLIQQLRDSSDGSIYGAVFQNNITYHNTPNSIVPPRYVIALRGTILTLQTMACDVKLNMRFAFENLHRGGRFVQAIQAIQNLVTTFGNRAVWIAGHSLGAGLAQLAGKIMAMYGCPVEAYTFNPPISLIPLEQLVESEDLKCAVRLIRDIAKAGIARVLDLNEGQGSHLFMNLASWRPHLFVNQSDPICSEYIGYFNHRDDMGELQLGRIERLARYSIRRILFGGGGESSSSSYSSEEHLHFLPSAFVMVNTFISPDFQTDHGIHQWWNPLLGHYSYQFNV
ncbi:PREDICTED: GDSL esterase/lipase At4g10955-like [Camelina sativa]|uniref:GDSL esterase/lipase At4g10955-like n=1 Tax=Camelina sativa TaxID=90675 RepID=A0ABM0T5N6_CAMSA|nr:PREDICTED: GDSL esterase/lipase At4g10955-like [Camelina sativa]